MRKTYCDRCGREIVGRDGLNFATQRFAISYMREDNTNNGYAAFPLGGNVDLCGTCEEELANWIFTNPVNR